MFSTGLQHLQQRQFNFGAVWQNQLGMFMLCPIFHDLVSQAAVGLSMQTLFSC